MNFEAFKNYYEAMTSFEPDKIKKAFLDNIRFSFKPNSKVFSSLLLSVAALVCLAVVATLGLAVAVICLAFALCSGCNPRNASSSKNIFTDGMFLGGLFGIPCLVGTIIQGFALPFQIIAFPFMLIAAAGMSCCSFMFSKPEKPNAEAFIGKDHQSDNTPAYLRRRLPELTTIANAPLQYDVNAGCRDKKQYYPQEIFGNHLIDKATRFDRNKFMI